MKLTPQQIRIAKILAGLLVVGMIVFVAMKYLAPAMGGGGSDDGSGQPGGPIGGPYTCPYLGSTTFNDCLDRGCMWDNNKKKCANRVVQGLTAEQCMAVTRRGDCNQNYHSDCTWIDGQGCTKRPL